MLLCVCIVWLLSSQQSSARPLSAVLQNQATFDAVDKLSELAQDVEAANNNNTSVRLITGKVRFSPDHHLDENRQICCLHANILDYYLVNVLHNQSFYSMMPHLKSNLARISQDLDQQGCNITHYHDHSNAVEFREKIIKMQGQRGIMKAIGEINILFSYLQNYCVQM
ncbi:hypothetical protein CRUP_013318 [Coryphaenoides rupestris]|nr:hypothetical protein CRUP_013318 [Coryphaenoides rupestris]